jgi:subtilisin family serine protease
VDWVTEEVIGPDGIAGTADDKKPAIATLSLSGKASRALNKAVRKSAASSVFYAVAAGNKGKHACDYSPASAGRTRTDAGWVRNNGIVTTAALNDSRQETRWSNYGDCVDLWGPGAKILSTQLGGGTTTMSGTSMAAPHVGGTAALYLSSHTGDAAATVEKTLKVDAVRNESIEKTSKDGHRIKLVYAGDY